MAIEVGTPSGGKKRVPTKEDNVMRGSLEEAIKFERHRQMAKQVVDDEIRNQAGDEDVFIRVDWDDIEAATEVPLGPDGVLPDFGIAQLYGPAGHGKTILAYWILIRRAVAKRGCGIYECEMGQDRAKGFMLNLGAKWRDLKKISYYRAEDDGEVINLLMHGRALDRLMDENGEDTLLLDSSNALMTAAGLRDNDANDFRALALAALQPVATRGGLGILLDHSRKDGNALRGTSDKPAAGDFVVRVTATTRFSRGKSGVLRLECEKDRNGTIETDSTMDITVECEEDGSIRLKPGKWVGPSEDQVRQKVPAKKANKSAQWTLVNGVLESDGPSTVKHIAAKSGLSQSSVRGILNRGKEDGEFDKDDDNIWGRL
jgi:hypothetical protein